MKRFIDDFSTLAVEECLIQGVPNLFSRDMIDEMMAADISTLAMETSHTSFERVRCTEKLAVLEMGLRDLQRLNKHQAMFSRELKQEESDE